MYDSVKETYQKLFTENPEGLHVITRILAGLTTGKSSNENFIGYIKSMKFKWYFI